MFLMNFVLGILALWCFAICTAVSPAGSTGCGKGDRCWRYCAGSSGPWCYTEQPCRPDCSVHATCASCAGASDGCVDDCETNTLPDVEQFSTKPIGSTNCNAREPSDTSPAKGDCWRRCEGTLGAWCYTGTADCDKESCYKRQECGSDLPCPSSTSTQCVKQCPQRQRMHQNRSESGVKSTALVFTIATVIVELLLVL